MNNPPDFLQARFCYSHDETVLVRYALYKTVRLAAWPGGPTFGAHIQKVQCLSQPMHASFTLVKNFLLTQTVKGLELFDHTRKVAHHDLILDQRACL